MASYFGRGSLPICSAQTQKHHMKRKGEEMLTTNAFHVHAQEEDVHNELGEYEMSGKRSRRMGGGQEEKYDGYEPSPDWRNPIGFNGAPYQLSEEDENSPNGHNGINYGDDAIETPMMHNQSRNTYSVFDMSSHIISVDKVFPSPMESLAMVEDRSASSGGTSAMKRQPVLLSDYYTLHRWHGSTPMIQQQPQFMQKSSNARVLSSAAKGIHTTQDSLGRSMELEPMQTDSSCPRCLCVFDKSDLVSPGACNFCEKIYCNACLAPCDKCAESYCINCSTPNYQVQHGYIVCIDCS